MQAQKERHLRENLLDEFKENDAMASQLHNSDVTNRKINSLQNQDKIERIRSIVQTHAAAASAAAEHEEQRPFRSHDDADEE